MSLFDDIQQMRELTAHGPPAPQLLDITGFGLNRDVLLHLYQEYSSTYLTLLMTPAQHYVLDEALRYEELLLKGSGIDLETFLKRR